MCCAVCPCKSLAVVSLVAAASERNDAPGGAWRGRPRRLGWEHFAHAAAIVCTPLLLHWQHKCLRRNFLRSLLVQYGMVVHLHVRRFQTSRTAFIVMLYCFASAEDVPSRGEHDALAK